MAYDAIIVGAGHNGIVTGIYLARAGWKVLILERNSVAGGAVRTSEVTLPGFKHDLFATNLNLFAGSGFYREFKPELHRHGLEFVRADRAFSSVYPEGVYLGVSTDLNATIEGIKRVSAHDARSWEDLLEQFKRNAPNLFPLLDVMMPSWNLIPGIYRGIRNGGWNWLGDTAQLLVYSSRNFSDTYFESEKVKSLVSAWGMHVDFPPDIAGGALMCYLESMSDQLNGILIGRGGAANVIHALTRLFQSLGGEIRYGSEVAGVEVYAGTAAGVKLMSGEVIRSSKAVIANVAPSVLFNRLVDSEHLSKDFKRKAERYRHGPGTMTIHLALNDLPGWTAENELQKYMYVHVAPYLEDMSKAYNEAISGLLPSSPFFVVGQPTAVDPSRAPDGKHIIWIQVRPLPGDIKGDGANAIDGHNWDNVKESYADRVIDKLSIYAPDIREKILARTVLSPKDLERENPNLVGGDSVCGSHHLDQNYLFRPFPGWSRYKTPVRNLFMVGAGTWPGAGVGAGSGRLLGKMLT